MAYQALYRVYRPKTFSEMVGQEVITKTLQNAIEKKQTGHAYLFAGPRGTGKTSAAKIFAREVNGIGPDQAGQSQPDIIEIDAASNNGVDEIRSIRDSANYAPIEAPYKIYIIDEAHMLSTGAFNALLKTLEEPPAQVKFILATTEIQKMPTTILSRTQRFEFKRLSNQTIKGRLEEILNKENQPYEEAALDVVATAAEGGMRDALSIMDQVIAFGPDKVTVDNALTVTGSVDIDQVLAYLHQVLAGDTAQALETLSQILLSGKDANRFLSDLIATLRDVMLVDLAPDLVKAKSKEDELKAFLAESSQAQIQEMLQVIDQIKTALAQSLQSDIYLEILTVQLAQKAAGKKNQTMASVQPQKATQVTPVADAKPAEEAVQSPAQTVVEQPVQETAPEQSQVQPVEKAVEEAAPSQPATPVEETPTVEAPHLDTDTGETPVQEELVDSVNEVAQAESTVSPVVEKKSSVVTEEQQPESQMEKASQSLTIYTGNEPVQAVLAQAKRDQLNKAQSEWKNIVGQLPVKDQAVLQTAEPMAASMDAIVLAFDYPALQDKAQKDSALQSELAQALSEEDLPVTLVMRSKDQWQNDRADYVKVLKAGQTVKIALSDLTPTVVAKEATDTAVKSSPAVVSADENKDDEKNDVVASAKALFGDDLVEVKSETK